MSIRLIALDLDNTLFDDNKCVSPLNKKAILAAKARGVKVVITTGRPLAAIGNLLEELGLATSDDYSITFNGGLIQTNTGRVLAEARLSYEELAKIFEVLSPLDLPMDVICGDTVYSLQTGHRPSLYPQANPALRFIPIQSLADLPREVPYHKVVCVQEEDYLNQQIQLLPDTLRDAFEVFKSREIILEIMPKGIHKAYGLEKLSQLLGIASCDVMAIGDEENDLTMIEWAGFGVAMKNAIPKLKALAQVVTKEDNNHSGVAEAMTKYVLEKGN